MIKFFISSLGSGLVPRSIYKSVLPLDVQQRKSVFFIIGLIPVLTIIAVISVLNVVNVPAYIDAFSRVDALVGSISFIFIAFMLPQAMFRTKKAFQYTNVISYPSRPPTDVRSEVLFFDAIIFAMLVGGASIPYGMALIAYLIGLCLFIVWGRRRQTVETSFPLGVLVPSLMATFFASSVGFIIVNMFRDVVTDVEHWDFYPEFDSLIIIISAALVAGCFEQVLLVAMRRWYGYFENNSFKEIFEFRRVIIWIAGGIVAFLSINVSLVFEGEDIRGVLSLLLVFICGWLIIWIVSVLIWKSEADQILDSWEQSVSDVALDLKNGTVRPGLAQWFHMQVAARTAMLIWASDATAVTIPGEISVSKTDQFYSTKTGIGAGQHLPSLMTSKDFSFIDSMVTRKKRPWWMIDIASDSKTRLGSVVIAPGMAIGSMMKTSKSLTNRYKRVFAQGVLTASVAEREPTDHVALYRNFFDPKLRVGNVRALESAWHDMRQKVENNSSLFLSVVCFELVEDENIIANPFDPNGRIIAKLFYESVRSDQRLASLDCQVSYEEPARTWLSVCSFHDPEQVKHLMLEIESALQEKEFHVGSDWSFSGMRTVSTFATYRIDGYTFPDLEQKVRKTLDGKKESSVNLPDTAQEFLRLASVSVSNEEGYDREDWETRFLPVWDLTSRENDSDSPLMGFWVKPVNTSVPVDDSSVIDLLQREPVLSERVVSEGIRDALSLMAESKKFGFESSYRLNMMIDVPSSLVLGDDYDFRLRTIFEELSESFLIDSSVALLVTGSTDQSVINIVKLKELYGIALFTYSHEYANLTREYQKFFTGVVFKEHETSSVLHGQAPYLLSQIVSSPSREDIHLVGEVSHVKDFVTLETSGFKYAILTSDTPSTTEQFLKILGGL